MEDFMSISKIKKGNWWETTAIKYSVVLKGFSDWMRDNKTNPKTDIYDNRHLRLKQNG